MPWQQHVLDVGLEIDPSTGELAYRELIVVVPRQSGKTTITLPRVVWRAEAAHLLGGRQKMLYTAQTGTAAREKWREDFLEDLLASRVMTGRFKQSLTPNNEKIRFRRSGSTFGPIPPGKTSGHGATLDDGTHDEAFAAVDGRVEEAWRPAMITRNQAQHWIVSTVGLPGYYLRNKMLRGRAIVESGLPSRTAYFEWSADKASDPADPATWRTCMPALGHTIREANIQHEFDTMEGGLPSFRRAYLNQWPDEFDDDPWVIEKTAWWACEDEESRRVGPPAWAIDMDPARTSSTVGFAAARADNLTHLQVVRHGEGSDWLVQHTADLVRAKGGTCVVMDAKGPAANKIEALKSELGDVCPVVALEPDEVANACSDIADAIITHQVRHVGQVELNRAWAGAVALPVGDRWKLGRVKSGAASGTNISPAVTVTLAHRGLAMYPGGTSLLY